MNSVANFDCEITDFRAPDTKARVTNYGKCEDGLNSKDQIQTLTNSDTSSVNKLLKQSLSALNVSSPALLKNLIMRNLTKKWRTVDYRKTRDGIYKDIKFCYKNALIVWCPLLDVQSDFIGELLNKFGEVETFHDRWIPDEYHFAVESWGGVFAVYSCKSEAKKAAIEITKRHG